jgi:hypothetical protein
LSIDDIIASVLNRNGHLTGRANRWTRERVTSLRSHHRITCYKPDEQQPWINLTDAAALLDISPRTLRLAIDRGEIPADHPFADGPWVISRDISAFSNAFKRVVSVTRRDFRRRSQGDVGEATLRPSAFSNFSVLQWRLLNQFLETHCKSGTRHSRCRSQRFDSPESVDVLVHGFKSHTTLRIDNGSQQAVVAGCRSRSDVGTQTLR